MGSDQVVRDVSKVGWEEMRSCGMRAKSCGTYGVGLVAVSAMVQYIHSAIIRRIMPWKHMLGHVTFKGEAKMSFSC